MSEHDIRQVTEAFRTSLAAGQWDAAAGHLHPDFVQEWPQSRERIVGAENALAIDRNFPGGLPSMNLRRVRAAGDVAVVEVELTWSPRPTAGSPYPSLLRLAAG